eukprot:5203230-Heterocapsa_arctica.AAC.1
MVPWLRMLPSRLVDCTDVENSQLQLQKVDYAWQICQFRVPLPPVDMPESENALNNVGLRDA